MYIYICIFLTPSSLIYSSIKNQTFIYIVLFKLCLTKSLIYFFLSSFSMLFLFLFFLKTSALSLSPFLSASFSCSIPPLRSPPLTSRPPLCSCPRRPLADPPLLPWLPGWFQRALRPPGEPRGHRVPLCMSGGAGL